MIWISWVTRHHRTMQEQSFYSMFINITILLYSLTTVRYIDSNEVLPELLVAEQLTKKDIYIYRPIQNIAATR